MQGTQLSTAWEGLSNQCRLVPGAFLRRDPLSIELMSYDKSSYAGCIPWEWASTKFVLWLLGSSQPDRLFIAVYRLPNLGVKGVQYMSRGTLGEIGVGHCGRWHRLQGFRAGRQSKSHSRFLGIEWGERLESRRTQDPLPCLPGS